MVERGGRARGRGMKPVRADADRSAQPARSHTAGNQRGEEQESLEQPEQGCQLSMVPDVTCCGLVSFLFLLEHAFDPINDMVVDEVKMSPVKYKHSKL